LKGPGEKIAATRQDIYAEQLASIPELNSLKLGPIIKSSLPIELTESETEYVVQCIKHIFKSHVVLQFDCTNTLNDQILERVNISIQVPDGFEIVSAVECPKLVYNIPGTAYICLSLETDDINLFSTTFSNVTLKYTVKDCDPNTGQVLDDEGYSDEYVLEDVDLLVADYMQRIMKPNFMSSWDEMSPDCEVEETYALSNFKTIEEAIKNIVSFMGMHACDRSDKVPEGKSSHTVYLSGIFRGVDEVLVRSKLALSATTDGVTMKLTVRSQNQEVAQFIASAIV